jgi:hypothetical protein
MIIDAPSAGMEDCPECANSPSPPQSQSAEWQEGKGGLLGGLRENNPLEEYVCLLSAWKAHIHRHNWDVKMRRRCAFGRGLAAAVATTALVSWKVEGQGPRTVPAACDGKTAAAPTAPAPSCHTPVCADKMNLFREAVKHHDKQTATASSSTNKGQTNNTAPEKPVAGSPSAPPLSSRSEDFIAGCPIDRIELGRSSWNLIHTLAAYYPDSPSAEQQKSAKEFVTSLSLLYPCHICQPHFAAFVKNSPPK